MIQVVLRQISHSFTYGSVFVSFRIVPKREAGCRSRHSKHFTFDIYIWELTSYVTFLLLTQSYTVFTNTHKRIFSEILRFNILSSEYYLFIPFIRYPPGVAWERDSSTETVLFVFHTTLKMKMTINPSRGNVLLFVKCYD